MFFTMMIVAGLGGFAGSCGRYLTGLAAKYLFGDSYPAGTFLANIIGCLIIGILAGLLSKGDINPAMNALLITGFCGGYTTFSSFSHDAYKMLVNGQWLKFILYIVPSVAIGLFMVWMGMQIA